MNLSDVLSDPINFITEFFGIVPAKYQEEWVREYQTKQHIAVKIQNKYLDGDETDLYAIWYAIVNPNKHVCFGAPIHVESKMGLIKSYVKHVINRLNAMKDNFISVTYENDYCIVLSNGSKISCNDMLEECIHGPSYHFVIYNGIDYMTDEQYDFFMKAWFPTLASTKDMKLILRYEKDNRPIFAKFK